MKKMPLLFITVQRKTHLCHSEERSDVEIRAWPPSERGLSPQVTGGENLRFLFSPSVMTYGHATSLTEGGFRNGLPRQSADWLAMTGFFYKLKKRRLAPSLLCYLVSSSTGGHI